MKERQQGLEVEKINEELAHWRKLATIASTIFLISIATLAATSSIDHFSSDEKLQTTMATLMLTSFIVLVPSFVSAAHFRSMSSEIAAKNKKQKPKI